MAVFYYRKGRLLPSRGLSLDGMVMRWDEHSQSCPGLTPDRAYQGPRVAFFLFVLWKFRALWNFLGGICHEVFGAWKP
jgi:hypothetical protein